jgi:hypothetical protein
MIEDQWSWKRELEMLVRVLSFNFADKRAFKRAAAGRKSVLSCGLVTLVGINPRAPRAGTREDDGRDKSEHACAANFIHMKQACNAYS